MLQGLEGIKENYKEDFFWELTEEEILNMFTPLQLVSYGNQKPSIVIVAIPCVIIILGIIGIVFTVRRASYEK